MGGFPAFFMFAYFAVVIGICVFVLVLLTRFVKAHQRCASALEQIARKLPGPGDE